MSTKPLWYRWARVYFAGACLTGLGVVLYMTIRPTDEQLIASFSPEVRAEYEKSKEIRQLEQKRLMEIVKQTSKSNDPIWKTGPIGSPLEKDQRNLSLELVDRELFHKTKAEEKQKEEINKSIEQSKELERLIKEKNAKKSWWRIF
ncbi:CBP4 [Candida jiufengensis]|uniref:CBP4 n=1 Tax=Candida jiufengensis TaxID=497108 RepID=UPI002224F223|nr:CBP4 [Candida jiufengensis]KAI5951571.1 CBP4 [Candida jiufengensis]